MPNLRPAPRHLTLVLLLGLGGCVPTLDTPAPAPVPYTPALKSSAPAATPGPTTRPTSDATPALTPSVTPTPAPTLTPPPPPPAAVVREMQVSPVMDKQPYPRDHAFEPTVASAPSDANVLAVVYQRYRYAGGCGLAPDVRISHNGGKSWSSAAAVPWASSGRCPDFHAVIAWGPGPKAGHDRLYWADATHGGGGWSASVAWSDDEGAHWSKLYTEKRTPPWVGGFPDIAVDRDPASPNYGVVYLAYNWLASATKGPGLHLLASPDYGRIWAAVEVPKAQAAAGFPAAWRIDYHVRTAPDGSAFVSSYQADLRHWDHNHIFARGGPANVSRHGFTVTKVSFDRARATFRLAPTVMALTLSRNAYTTASVPAPGTSGNVNTDPQWSSGLDVDRSDGTVYLAAADYRSTKAGAPRGIVQVARSTDGGQTWSAVALPALPAYRGHAQSSFKPTLTARDGVVFVGFHGLTDYPVGTRVSRNLVTVGTYWAVSADHGRSFGPAQAASAARWNAGALARTVNGAGLRERADFTAAGFVFYVWGDGRRARPAPSAAFGRAAVYGALIWPGAASIPAPGTTIKKRPPLS